MSRSHPWTVVVVLLVALSGATLAGCGATSEPLSGDLREDLLHDDPRLRIRAAVDAVAYVAKHPEDEALQREIVLRLIDNLDHRDGAVRTFAYLALRKITGEEHGYRPEHSAVERRRAIELWRRSMERQEGLVLPQATSRPASPSDDEREF